jgi:alpha-glucosidase
MNKRVLTMVVHFRVGLLVLALGLSGQIIRPHSALAQVKLKSADVSPATEDFVTSKLLPNGIEVRRNGAMLQVVALRDDVLRVRLAVKGQLPEDASWAVPVEIRRQSVEVIPEITPDAVGFRTKTLRVRIERATLRLSTADLRGNVLQEDEPGWPVEFHADSFRVFKKMPADEHYFGLGDKVGTLDRRGQSFHLWNTDAFLFQESTDPIYKSIPFFMTMRAGRAAGIFLDNTWPSNFDFGKMQDGIYSFGAEGGPINYYIFYGPDPKQVVRTYAWLTGLRCRLYGRLVFSSLDSAMRRKRACVKLPRDCAPIRFPRTRCIWTSIFRKNIVPSR